MQTQLPRRPYVELPPPPDGLVTAQREGSRRRTRRTVAAFTGGVSAVVLVIVAVVLLGGGGGVAVLRPAPVPPATRLPSPGVSKAPALVNGGAHAGTSANPTQRGGHAGLSSLQSPPHSGARVGSTSAAGGRQSSSTVVTVTRQPGRNPDAPNVCRSGFSSDNSSTHIGDDWCPAVAAVAVDGGVRLSYRLCRDSTTGGTLHFAGTREVEFTVTRNDSTVWRYSAHSADAHSPHTLTAAADDCWTWSLVWPGATDAGTAAPRARYTVNASSTADELAGAHEYSASFDY